MAGAARDVAPRSALTRLAWALCVLSVALALAGVALAAVNGKGPADLITDHHAIGILTALVVAPIGALIVVGDRRHLLVGAGLLLLVCWNAGTAIGTFAGDLVADPESLGLDAAFPALFLALLWSQVRERSRLLAALGGAAIALALMPFTGPGIPIVAASLACLVGARKSS